MCSRNICCSSFKDVGCSYPYFESVVDAIRNSSLRRFIVPYEFINAHNETLVLDIQEKNFR
jgi:hypothetical protein